MGGKNLIGRDAEYKKLEECMKKTTAQLVVVTGRRRVGKTFLINEFFEKQFDFKLTGEFKAPKAVQLENFTLELNRRTQKNHPVPSRWKTAFEQLRFYISSLPNNEKHIIFFDEMPWMDTPKSDFLSSFEYFWNDFGCARDNLIFIICGSATSWISEKIEHNKGGLFNRLTCSLFLQPFTLQETEAYLHHAGMPWSRYDIAECYMIIGGIPYYLDFLSPEQTLSENIDQLFFRKSAYLLDEFDQLYRTLFSNSDQYVKIVEALSKKRRGMIKQELAEKSGLSLNGELTKKLNALIRSGFVRVSAAFHLKKKEMQYQLCDYFSLFYFRFVKNNYGKDEHFWTHNLDNPVRRAWAGLTFEQLCKDHLGQIKQKLGISGVLTRESTWQVPAKPSDAENTDGAQIDMVLDRRDHIITLCEMKFSLNEYEIDKAYDRSLRNKIETFRKQTGTTKTLQLAMVTTFGVKKNKYSNLVGRQVLLDDLFRPLI